MRSVRGTLFAGIGMMAGLLLGADGAARAELTFHCGWDASCPEITVAGDPPATLGGGPSPFRGYGDPSLERDPATGAIWMSYSWLQLLVSSPGPPPVTDFGVATYLARSDDGGQTFTFVRALNDNELIQHPDTSGTGWTSHEVSTIVRQAGGWEALWLTYFDPLGPPGYRDVYYNRSLASTPASLGDTTEAWARGYGTTPSFGAEHNLSTIPQLSDCIAFSEPALLAYGRETYLATNCVVFAGGERRPDLERLVLLREDAGGYAYVGVLLDYGDALDNGAERIEQADLAVAQNGAILLIGTPIQAAQPNHLGCRVFEVTDIAGAQVRRDGGGQATVLASITGDDGTIGPGLCTYDAASATGIVMVLHDFVQSPFDMNFSMRATGVHPQGLDTDGDGRADSVDPCPTFAPPWFSPDGDSDCDGYADSLTAGARAGETAIGTLPLTRCAATPAANDEPLPDAWPPDLNDNQLVNGADFLTLNPFFGSHAATGPPYDARHDLSGNGVINGQEFLQMNPFFGKYCA